jgi:hypothetical protein
MELELRISFRFLCGSTILIRPSFGFLNIACRRFVQKRSTCSVAGGAADGTGFFQQFINGNCAIFGLEITGSTMVVQTLQTANSAKLPFR